MSYLRKILVETGLEANLGPEVEGIKPWYVKHLIASLLLCTEGLVMVEKVETNRRAKPK